MSTLAKDPRLRAYGCSGVLVAALERGMSFEFGSILDDERGPYGRVWKNQDPPLWLLQAQGLGLGEDNPDTERVLAYYETVCVTNLVGEMARTKVQTGTFDENDSRWRDVCRNLAYARLIEDFSEQLVKRCIPEAFLTVGDVETWKAIESLADFLLFEQHASYEQSRDIYERTTGRTVEVVWG